MAWTKAQQKVIDTRNKNLLVSAAAGSGKTAVLVERIIAMISEGEHPIDIDQLLVVTFTNAAAAEMRERIGKAIDKKLVDHPENKHLQKQMSLLQSAQITTIHSFCLNVIRNYFHRIDLDPSFKIAEETEITLMKSDVIAELLERWYEEGSEEFHSFVESYSYSKSDLPIEDLILQLYSFSMSDPWPRSWIEQKRGMFSLTSSEEMNQAPWMKELLDYIKVVLGDLQRKNGEALAICTEAGGPTAYEAALLSDRSILETLMTAAGYEEYASLFPGISYTRLSSKREEGVEEAKKERVKGLREEVKKGIKDLAGQYFFQSPEEMLQDLQQVGVMMQVLFDLTLEFMEEFAKKKEEKNLIDFNDLEHFALKILVKEQEGEAGYLPTQAALELSEQFEEILIDEYQDSNMVQETILRSISREDLGKPNRFMVGDVKQSIYKFRLAMPEIFMQKYNTYSCEERTEDGSSNDYLRIDLDRNFRSRQVVLTYVNQIFEQIMQRFVGGIVYDDAAALKYGELYEETLQETQMISEETAARIACDVELLLITEEASDEEEDSELSQVETEENEEEAVYTKKEMEARVISGRIKELTDPETGMLVFDQKNKTHRPAEYRDIVILLRSMTGWAEVFVNTLMQEGIPAYADTGTGYFQTIEIMTVLNMLRIIDNPMQDIPLTGVLYSPMVGLTTTELALIRSGNRNVSMYRALLAYAKDEDGKTEYAKTEEVKAEGVIVKDREEELPDSKSNEQKEETSLKEKVNGFLKQLEEFRAMVNHKPIHELLQLVLDQTGYYYYVSAMPGGEQRKANIDMLIARAVRFEKGSYSGLFHFIRYIEKLHKYEVDFGEASTSGEQDNTVRIMSIHKSKGLEFPVVMVGGMSKQFNTQDLRSSIVLHSELGVGPEYIDSRQRTKVPTLLKKAIQKKIQIENLGEELRVLYVAMTRAREKLILTGYLKAKKEIKARVFSFFELLAAKSYLDWVLPAMVNRMGRIPSLEEDTILFQKGQMSIQVLTRKQLLKEELKKQIFIHQDTAELSLLGAEEIYDQEIREEIKTRFNSEYPYRQETALKVKMTVSELKKLGQFQDEEQSVNLYQKIEAGEGRNTEDRKPKGENVEYRNTEERDIESGIPMQVSETLLSDQTIPTFLRQSEAVTSGTDRGTLYHKVLELIELSHIQEKKDVILELNRLVGLGKLSEDDVKKLKQDYIYGFAMSDVAKRMMKAKQQGKLYQEQQFVIGIEAREVVRNTDSEELVLIQGIIDVFFEEDGELVLLDYKSDLVSNEEQLVKRYRVQLQYYKRALEQMLQKRVKEMLLYSLSLAKEIRIEE